MLSQFVEERHASDLLGTITEKFSYLRKDRISDVDEFIEALRHVRRPAAPRSIRK